MEAGRRREAEGQGGEIGREVDGRGMASWGLRKAWKGTNMQGIPQHFKP